MSGTFSERYFQNELLERINEEIESRKTHLVAGMASGKSDYRERVGYLRALYDVCGWAADINDDMNARPKRDVA